MGHEQHRLAVGVPQFQQQIAHDLSGLGIERPERLVHQQNFWIADQDLGETDALALPAREHMRIAVAERAETHRRQPALRALQRLLARRALDLESDGDIVDRGLPGEQRIGLEQIAGVPIEPGQRLAEDFYRSGRRLEQPGGDIEQRGFAASGGADNGDELAMHHRKIGLFDRGIDARIGEAKRHRRIVKRDRIWLCRIHRVPPPGLG